MGYCTIACRAAVPFTSFQLGFHLTKQGQRGHTTHVKISSLMDGSRLQKPDTLLANNWDSFIEGFGTCYMNVNC